MLKCKFALNLIWQACTWQTAVLYMSYMDGKLCKSAEFWHQDVRVSFHHWGVRTFVDSQALHESNLYGCDQCDHKATTHPYLKNTSNRYIKVCGMNVTNVILKQLRENLLKGIGGWNMKVWGMHVTCVIIKQQPKLILKCTSKHFMKVIYMDMTNMITKQLKRKILKTIKCQNTKVWVLDVTCVTLSHNKK